MPTKPARLTRPCRRKCDTRALKLKIAEDIRRSSRWRKHSRAMRRLYPLCQCDSCKGIPIGREVSHRPAVLVHHIMPISVDPSQAFDRANTVPICRECHDRLSAMETRGKTTKGEFTRWTRLQ